MSPILIDLYQQFIFISTTRQQYILLQNHLRALPHALSIKLLRLYTLHFNQTQAHIGWIPLAGHAGILGNKLADAAAKRAISLSPDYFLP
jgi:hypothetical protein